MRWVALLQDFLKTGRTRGGDPLELRAGERDRRWLCSAGITWGLWAVVMFRRTSFALLPVALVACSNPLPFGPGRIAIDLQQAAVAAVDHEALFPGVPRSAETPARREVLQLTIASDRELLTYFKERDRELQVRCVVDGSANGKRYRGFALGPVALPRVTSERTEPVSAPYRYPLYAFVDLKADEERYEGGRPASVLDLKTGAFESLSCHLLGVAKAPVLFPRSNDVVVSVDKFRVLLSDHLGAAARR